MPLVKLNVTLRLAGNPAVELFPKASWLLTTGWTLSVEPAVPLPGWVLKASALAAAGLTAIVVEVALVRVPLAKRMVMLLATLCDRLV